MAGDNIDYSAPPPSRTGYIYVCMYVHRRGRTRVWEQRENTLQPRRREIPIYVHAQRTFVLFPPPPRPAIIIFLLRFYSISF